MSDSYVGEIRMFGFSRVPQGWLACDGALHPISQYSELFSVIGSTYGGDGQTSFATPQLSGRVPVHQGTGPGLSPYVPGQKGGAERVSLLTPQLPAHGHPMAATPTVADATAVGTTVMLGSVANDTMYATDLTGATPFLTSPQSTEQSGGATPHDNTMPTLTVQFCIAWTGEFPEGSPQVA